jgi:hypothetical protein
LKHQSEMVAQKHNYDMLLGRSAQTEKAFEELRCRMQARAEEIQSFNRRLAESLQPPPMPGTAETSVLPTTPAPARATQPLVPRSTPREPAAPASLPAEPRLPIRTYLDDRAAQPVVERRGWRSNLFDWIAGRSGS